jgi:hypothetical protein
VTLDTDGGFDVQSCSMSGGGIDRGSTVFACN